jgi:MarR family transcriptional regulator, transcriptional regulator for hemolysin
MQVKGKGTWDHRATPTFWINHASRALVREFERRLRPLDFGMAYLPVVVALEEEGALQQKELAERAHVEQPTMAALLTRMERDGLIARSPHPTDKRASLVSLTPKAVARLPKMKEQLRIAADRATTGVTARERELVMAVLQRVVANLSEPDD